MNLLIKINRESGLTNSRETWQEHSRFMSPCPNFSSDRSACPYWSMNYNRWGGGGYWWIRAKLGYPSCWTDSSKSYLYNPVHPDFIHCHGIHLDTIKINWIASYCLFYFLSLNKIWYSPFILWESSTSFDFVVND